jgi:hypothetical protein
MTTILTTARCPLCGGELPEGAAHCARATCGVALSWDTGRPAVATFRLHDHYSLCVLPFAFDEARRGEAVDRLAASPRWTERVFSLADADDVDRTEYFLPYIRRFLFPTLFESRRPEGAAKRTCWRYDFDLDQLGETGPDGLPLTLRGRLGPIEDATAALLLEHVELIVFSYRVGFLVLRVRCTDAGATYFDQMEVLAQLRAFVPPYREFTLPVLEAGAARFRMSQLLPFFLAEFGGEPVRALAVIPADAPLPVKPTYDDRLMVYAFSCLDQGTALDDIEHNERLLCQHAVVNFDRKAMQTAVGAKRPRDVAAWARARWQAFTKDGGLLVVFNTDRFHGTFLGGYHASYYFDIFVLAALQRVTLLTLFEQLSDIRALITGDAASRQLLRRVRRDLLLFKNQCTFSQITNRERGLVLWKKWQTVFETRTLVREVNQQSEELDAYLQGRYRERMDWLVRLGGLLGTALPALWGLEMVLGKEAWVQTLRWVLIGVLLLGAAALAWFVLFHRTDEDA